MAFTPTQNFNDCSSGLGITAGDQMVCDQIKQVELRQEELFNHYLEKPGAEYLPSIENYFGQFWILFQVLFLAIVIAYVGRWFWRLIN
jgi:hypothetical protein